MEGTKGRLFTIGVESLDEIWEHIVPSVQKHRILNAAVREAHAKLLFYETYTNRKRTYHTSVDSPGDFTSDPYGMQQELSSRARKAPY